MSYVQVFFSVLILDVSKWFFFYFIGMLTWKLVFIIERTKGIYKSKCD